MLSPISRLKRSIEPFQTLRGAEGVTFGLQADLLQSLRWLQKIVGRLLKKNKNNGSSEIPLRVMIND